MIDAGVSKSGDGGSTSLSLLVRVRADDQAAWARLVGLYGKLVYHWCLRAGLHGEDAADVGQEVFIAVARTIQAFRRDRPGDSFRGWLFTITRNKIRDWVNQRAERAQGGHGQGLLDQLSIDPILEPNDSSVLNDRRHLLHRTIELVRAEFEANTWEAFWNTTVEDRSADDVANALGMTRAAVYIAKSRVRRRLLAEFGDLIELGSWKQSEAPEK